jgi:hypothetical protein
MENYAIEIHIVNSIDLYMVILYGSVNYLIVTLTGESLIRLRSST